MKVAILGATSFLARRCATHLARRGHEVIPFTRPNARKNEVQHDQLAQTIDIANLGKSFLYDLMQFDAIVNCIGAGVQPNHAETTSSIWQANAFAPISLIELLAECVYRGKLITFGSYFELGEINARHLLDEEEFLASRAPLPNAYCRSKRALTRYAADRHATGLPFEHLHCILTNLYGPGENLERLIPYIFRQVAAGQPMHFSLGSQQRQYTHVDDVAAWLSATLELQNGATGIFNLTNETVSTVREVIEETLAFLANRKFALPPIEFAELSKRDLSMSYLALSSERARKELGWNPSISLAQGIASYHDSTERDIHSSPSI